MKPSVLIAPDSFKGSLDCAAVAQAIGRGVGDAWPEAQVRLMPLSDGGEGLVEALSAANPGRLITEQVQGPLGAPVQADWWASESCSVVEMAQASGLALIEQPDVRRADTTGTGQLLASALEQTSGPVLLGAGGSATVDGGAGALRALGFRCLDAADRPLPPGGAALTRLARIEPPADLDRWRGRIVVLSDVRNPMIGPEGAATVYGPQKGADPEDVQALEAGLTRWCEVIAATLGRNPGQVPGAGAAGGLAGGLWAGLGAEIRSGLDEVAEQVGLESAIAEAALVITGEGRVDGQTAWGKVAAGVIRRAADLGRPVVVLGGSVTPEAERWAASARVDGWPVALIPVTDGPRTLADCMTHADALVRRAAARAIALFRLARVSAPGAGRAL